VLTANVVIRQKGNIMRKKILSVILSSLLVMSLTACGDKSPSSVTSTSVSTTETSVSVETPASTETSVSTPTDSDTDVNSSPEYGEECELVYRNILQDAYNVIYYGMEPINRNLSMLLYSTIYYTDAEKEKVSYGFVDIDGNGRSEMIIATGNTIHAICTYNEETAEVLFSVGYRSSMNIYENGSVVIEGSSGAACYSYNFYSWENGTLKCDDFYYTDTPVDGGDLIYYHNKTAEWSCAPEDEITEDEFNISTDIGLEVLDFSKYLQPLSNYTDVWGGGSNGITWSELTDTSWDLEYTQDGDFTYDTSDLVMQYIEIKDNGTVVYCHNDEGHDYWTTDVEVNIDEYYNRISLSLTDELDRKITLNIIGKDALGHLVVQRIRYDTDTYDEIVVNEYYKITMG